MKQNIHEIYTWTLKKYQKYHSRYLSGVKTGRFYDLSTKKQQQIVSRLEKLVRRLKQLKLQLKIAIATGAISFCLHASPAKAQQLGPFVQNNEANPFYRPPLTGTHKKLTFADLDNDGDFDVAIGLQDGTIQFFENVGSPTTPRFIERTGADNPFDGITASGGFAAPDLEDLDDDGDFDLILGERDYTGDLRYFQNTDFEDDGILGNGVLFTELTGAGSPINGVSGQYSDVKPSVADIDGDGDLDIFIGNDRGYSGTYGNGQAFSFYRNTGSGFTFQDAYTYLPGLPTFFYGAQNIAPTLSDFDGDGDLDLFLTRSYYNQVRFFENTDIDGADNTFGNPNFIERTGVNNPFDGISIANVSVLSFVDIDQDGDNDAFLGTNYGFEIRFFENNGAGSFVEQTGIDNPFDNFDLGEDVFPTFADIDGDNNLDAIIGEKFSQTLYYFRNNGDGTVTEQQGATENPFDNIISLPAFSFDSPTPEFNDIDNDGDLDLFIGIYYGSTLPYPGQVRFYQNDGSNNFSSATSPISDYNYNVLSPSFGDLDNDSDLDVALGARNGYVRFSRNQDIEDDGTLTQAVPSFIDETGASNPLDEIDAGYSYSGKIKPKLVDLDHDGDLDLAAGAHGYSTNLYTGQVRFFLNDGSSNFTNQTSTNNPFAGIDVGRDSSPAFVDWDKDGDLDLFIGNAYGQIFYFENQNEAPQTSGDPTVIGFIEGDPAVIIDASLTITDDTNDEIISATISILNNYVQGEDIIDVSLEGGTSGSFDPTTGVYTITGTATVAEYQNMLRSATFYNTNIEDPTPNARSIEFAVTDFDATNPNLDGAAEFQKSLIVTAINDAPTAIGSTGTLTYTENQSPLIIDNGITINDVDNTNLDGATITITANFVASEDILTFSNQNGISGSYDAQNGVLILSGPASVADYQTAIRSVTYQNSSDDPNNATRTIEFAVFDGALNSAPVSRDVEVTPVNDAPELTSDNNTALDYTQNEASVMVDDLITVIDLDNDNMVSATVTIGNFQTGDNLLFNDQNNITGDFSAGTLTLTGTDSKANYTSALQSVEFESTNGQGTRTITFVVNDGADDSQPLSRSVNITAEVINQPPAVNTSPQSTQLGSILTFDWCAIIDDPDNDDSELTVEVISTLSEATGVTDGCNVIVDYSNSTFTGIDEIVLEACDPSGACDQNIINVTVNEIPPVNIYNALSPNGDGLNDLWEIVGLTSPNSIEVFNRWGDSVKSFSDVDINAELDLSDLPAGTYFYKINSPEGEFKGYIVIKK